MEIFSYKAIGSDGRERKGSLEGQDRDDVARQLKADGLIPITITTQTLLDKDINLKFGVGKKVKVRDLSVFCRQFSSILGAGVSVVNALSMLAEETENPRLRASITNVQVNVEKGETLSSAMKQEKDVFPSLLVSMVAAGEASGSLDIAIERMAVQFEKDNKIKGMVKKAMMYPIVLCFVAIAVVIVMLTAVIPKFVTMFEDIGTELPALTRAILAMSNFIMTKWYILLLVIAAIIFGYKYYSKSDDGKRVIAGLKLKIPVFGKLVQKTACARFSRTLSTLLSAGMPMLEAIDITSRTMDNVLYEEALLKVKNGIGLGLELSTQLKAVGLFPAMIVNMTGIGEQTGQLEEMLLNAAEYYDEEVEVTTQQVTALMEPAIILLMAAIVGVLIMAIYGPMITLYDTLGNA